MFKQAAKIAQQSTHKQHHMGAVVVKGRRILSSASNKVNRGCHTITQKRWPDTLHAEAAAIAKLINSGHISSLYGSDLYVTRINAKGRALNSKPCSFCEKLMRDVGIKRVFYHDEKGEQSAHRIN